MFPLGFFSSRFFLTYGILFFAALLPLIIWHKPFGAYIHKTQAYSDAMARSRILGYQTPDFKALAEHMNADYVFTPADMDTYSNGEHYLLFYQKASELYPNQFEMFYMQGICYFWENDWPHAEESLRQSLQINPVFFWSYYNLGLLELKAGNIDAALALFTRAREIPPELTKKFMHILQAFFIIWRFMPDPEGYMDHRLQQAESEINYFALVALAVKNHRGAETHFNPDQWHPVFF